MNVPADHGVFKPTTSRAETKSDMTDRAAKAIIASEAAALVAKTARLRAERIALQQAQDAIAASEPKPKSSVRPRKTP